MGVGDFTTEPRRDWAEVEGLAKVGGGLAERAGLEARGEGREGQSVKGQR